MYCKNCGNKIDGNSKFCACCGTKVENENKIGGVLNSTYLYIMGILLKVQNSVLFLLCPYL
jgi:hypothetical protein